MVLGLARPRPASLGWLGKEGSESAGDQQRLDAAKVRLWPQAGGGRSPSAPKLNERFPAAHVNLRQVTVE